MTEKNIKNNKDYSNRNSYTLIQDYFLVHWVNTIGLGPAILYLELLSYCHKGKDTAWPSIKTLNQRMGITTKTGILSFGLIIMCRKTVLCHISHGYLLICKTVLYL